MKNVVVVDYGMGNLDSVRRALEECGARPQVSHDPSSLAAADAIILPGVGAFPLAMRRLHDLGFDVALADEVVGAGVPLLGICLGMQLLARTGDEGRPTAGLALLDAEIRRLAPVETGERVPHVGWNDVHPVTQSGLFGGIPDATDFYFVHSFHVVCGNEEDVLATTDYCGGFTSAVARGNIFAVQFHPEKSQRHGLTLLRNFLAL